MYFFGLKYGNQSIKIGDSVLVYKRKAMPGTGTAKKHAIFERDDLVVSCMGMFVFPFCTIVFLYCKIVSDIVHTSGQLERTKFIFIIVATPVDAGTVNGLLFNALFRRADLRHRLSQCTCGLRFAFRMSVRKCHEQN